MHIHEVTILQNGYRPVAGTRAASRTNVFLIAVLIGTELDYLKYLVICAAVQT